MKKQIWLFISAFGIMFAVFSWLQESSLIPSANELEYLKGVYALVTGLFLYLFFRKSL
tara:strand:- start:33 stop:206 length:174 start_codon:yes stop_codon:yes gene_type:complete